VHSLGVLCASDGNIHHYNLLRRAQEATEAIDVVRLPELTDNGFIDLVCDHPVCKEVCRICCSTEPRMPVRSLIPAWKEPAGRSDPSISQVLSSCFEAGGHLTRGLLMLLFLSFWSRYSC